MSARRWVVLVGFALVSLVLTLGWALWAAFNAQPGQRMSAMGLTAIINLLEIPLAYFLLRLSDYAHAWTVRLNLMKLVGAAAFGLGLIAGGAAPPESAAVAGAIGGFYLAYTLFLHRNAQFFD